jgi:hypothetical protein
MSSIKTQNIPLLPEQQARLECPYVEDLYGAEYYSGIYSRPLSSVPNCFSNSLECYEQSPSKSSFKLKLNQAWDTYDRKLRGFEFETNPAYTKNNVEYDNAESAFIDFTVEEKVITINSYLHITEIYRENINSYIGLFRNYKDRNTVHNKNDVYISFWYIDMVFEYLNCKYNIDEYKFVLKDKEIANDDLEYQYLK